MYYITDNKYKKIFIVEERTTNVEVGTSQRFHLI